MRKTRLDKPDDSEESEEENEGITTMLGTNEVGFTFIQEHLPDLHDMTIRDVKKAYFKLSQGVTPLFCGSRVNERINKLDLKLVAPIL